GAPHLRSSPARGGEPPPQAAVEGCHPLADADTPPSALRAATSPCRGGSDLVFRQLNAALARLLILVARAWQLGPSRVLPPTCRYAPSCSQYAIEALSKHGAIKGGWLALKRLLRCHPWGGHGYDPVPPPRDRDVAPNGDDAGPPSGAVPPRE